MKIFTEKIAMKIKKKKKKKRKIGNFLNFKKICLKFLTLSNQKISQMYFKNNLSKFLIWFKIFFGIFLKLLQNFCIIILNFLCNFIKILFKQHSNYFDLFLKFSEICPKLPLIFFLSFYIDIIIFRIFL